ncbi:alkylphosphocholine resistance protein lem3 [Tilletia horrida]|uniref:Alkylphosphocholine resistance protein lem3 n=1 Tax=Tilletia horrida TaxID=155126 RepID=A0AAN6GLC8_9BASI|nr:alkylphosphocholine resistance protein lem3 [Tilletia horrida]KAK0548678.1 alkylphosphocholine resistance protein lem3 [Tilletia horrida]KAK0565588.1 alkylphosphocholine resistance protein lem3 [Tilletia horrida]
MAVTNRRSRKRSNSSSDDAATQKHKSRRPPTSAWRAQKLPAWQPLMTPRTTISVLFIVGFIVAPIGAIIFYFSTKRTYIQLDYTRCKSDAPSTQLADMPKSAYDYQIEKSPTIPPPQWSYIANSTAPAGSACRIFFTVPESVPAPVLLSYRLTNFHQNHRKYVKGVNTAQMKGSAPKAGDLKAQCRPFSEDAATGKPIYPCGLIANSMFNDTISDLYVATDNGNLTASTFTMSESNLVMEYEKHKYAVSTYNPADVVPPPFWRGSDKGAYGYAGGYGDGSSNSTRPLFDPTKDEHFMVWMDTAALPNFEKLYKRSDSTSLGAGRYAVDIFDNWPVEEFKGTKSVVLTTAGWQGSRNTLLGLIMLGSGGLCLILGLTFTARYVAKPRKLGQMR